jgi:uncharacterized protein (DUF433 family)
MKRPLNELAEEALEQFLLPPHPYIEKARMTSGWRPVIKGTRIPVSIIVGYVRAGETPESLASAVIPHVSLAAIYDALSYYHDHKEEIEAEIAENQMMADPKYLRERLGEEDFKRITGQLK